MDNDLEKLLEIENNDEILKYKFSYDNFLMWPVVRWQILSKALNNYEEQTTKKTLKKKDLLKYSFNVILKYPYFVKNTEITSFGTTVSNFFDKRQVL